ncbi:MAG: tRNA dihydrouridine synthase DusB [Bacteroidetes bacterium 4572_112]|nr:MAG: tRNA dihydrouridine synthase DusB [Bacteroidetes bacterium 4572_112]
MKIRDIDLGEMPLFLAPMEDVTDPSFRAVCKPFGVDMMYTEFISSEGLIRDAQKSLRKLKFEESERPVGIQIFGHAVDSMVEAAKVSAQANPDVIDINFGCPVKKVVGKGAGAALLKDIPQMLKITEAVVKAVDIPVTVKTRLGWNDDDKPIVQLAEQLQDVGVEALTIHGRTRNQMYKGVADWTLIGEAKNNPRLHIPIIGNGDISSAAVAVDYMNRYGVDGLMVGRATIGNPWIFKQIKHLIATGNELEAPSMDERIEVCKNHLQLSLKWKGEQLSIREMRKHYSNYFRGYRNIKPFRLRLVTSNSVEEVHQILEELANANLELSNT